MPFQNDPFGHKAYHYVAGEGKLVERNPDRRMADGDLWFSDEGNDTRMFMEVRGLGALEFHCTTGHDDGKIRFEGLALFTREDILFD